jgi:hypothetical protein
MELALARIDAMIGVLKNKVKEGTNPQAAEDMARYQQWRDDLDVQIRVERIKRATYPRGARPLLHSWAAARKAPAVEMRWGNVTRMGEATMGDRSILMARMTDPPKPEPARHQDGINGNSSRAPK